MSIVRIEGQILHYPWGSRTHLAEILGREGSGRPEAELWMGAHRSAPSRLIDASTYLDAWLAEDPEARLGAPLVERFGAKLPFLFKVIAAEAPLSLQVHPSIEQAREGFLREDRLGIAVDALERNYKDDNHKPELVCALGPFYALSGFREPRDALALLSRFGVSEPGSPLFDAWRSFHASPDTLGLRRFFERLFALEIEDVRRVIDAMIERAAGPAASEPMAVWVRRLAAAYPVDPGVVASLLLELLTLEAGESIELEARQLHAYLGGVGLELMASSDNVLRAGLTKKHVDVPELLRVVDFSPRAPRVERGEEARSSGGARVRRYGRSAAEFELNRISLDPGARHFDSGPAIWICLGGAPRVTSGAQSFEMRSGEQFFASAEGSFELIGAGEIALARVNGRA